MCFEWLLFYELQIDRHFQDHSRDNQHREALKMGKCKNWRFGGKKIVTFFC